MFDFCIGAFRASLWDADARRRLREMGVRQLSVSCEDFMSPQYGREDALRLCELLLEDGLRAVTSHPPFGSFNEPFSLLRQDPEGRARDIEWMREFLVRCGLLKIQAIPLHTGGAMLPDSREWEIACAESYVRALLPTAERANVIIAVENTNHATPIGFYPGVPEPVRLNKNIWKFDDTDRILRFVHGFNSRYVRVCYDTGHSHLLGKMMEDMQRFLPDIALFHLHDNDGAGNDAHLQPGYGNAPWRSFFEALRTLPEPPILFIEAAPHSGNAGTMLDELNAIAENRVVVKPGGFLKKDEDSGRIVVLAKEDAAC